MRVGAPLDSGEKREAGRVPMREAVTSQQRNCEGSAPALGSRMISAITTTAHGSGKAGGCLSARTASLTRSLRR
jgi:hypothetical protein